MPAMNRPGFVTKSGLRTFITSDNVGPFGRKRSSGEYSSPEKDRLHTVQADGANDVTGDITFSTYNQPRHHTGFAGTLKSESGKPAKPHNYEFKSEKKIQSQIKKEQTGDKLNWKTNTETPSEGIYSTEFPWKTFKKVNHLTSKEFSCGISGRTAAVSSLSSDVQKYLPYAKGPAKEAKLQESTCSALDDIGGKVKADNVHTDRLSQIVMLNNNHTIYDKSRNTESDIVCTQIYDAELISQIPGNPRESVLNKSGTVSTIQAPHIDMKKGDESLSYDESFSETEDKSDAFSVVWSEEERDVEEKTKLYAEVYAEKNIVVPEPLPYTHPNRLIPEASFNKWLHNDTAESLLSEILSPIDEILSYGSAELPSIKGGVSGLVANNLPLPPPAFEIITWTSEDNFPGPPELAEDISLNSECIPALPVDLSNTHHDHVKNTYINNDIVIVDKTRSPRSKKTDPDQENEGSEYTISILVDECNESQEPMSFFNIGDTVLVCNSRPGVLKYKGYTRFADGFWAGVALDMPDGNHNGTLQGVKYFTCEKNHGVLVREEDISFPHQDHYSNLDAPFIRDDFADVDPSGKGGKNRRRPNGYEQGKIRSRSPGHDSSVTKQTFIPPCENDEARNKTVKTSRSTEKPAIKKEACNYRLNKPCLMDQWQQVFPESPPLIRVKPHENGIVCRLVDVTVEMLCGQENDCLLHACETPNFLVDDESRKMYRQVMVDLASEIFHEVCDETLEIHGYYQKREEKSMCPLIRKKENSVKHLKTVVRREAQKVLNLEQTDQQMTGKLQSLCKYWGAKRDIVDYVLIQELYNEEKQWVDYSTDQITVKICLAEDIFCILLDDTISVLNHLSSQN